MTKAQVVEAVSIITGLSKATVARVIDCYHEVIRNGLKSHEKVTFADFGTFSVSQRQARTGRNPKTGKAIAIRASKVARFKASSSLIKAIK